MRSASAKTKTYLGVFMLVLGAVGALAVMFAGDDLGYFRKSRSFHARFENTAGLVSGAPVRMGGVEIGRVEGIAIDSSGSTTVIVATLRIDSPYFEMIRSDASVNLDTQGMLGDKFVAVNSGSARNMLHEGQTIATIEGEGMAQAMARSQTILDAVASTTAKLDLFANGLPPSDVLAAMTKDLTASATSLREMMARLNADDSLVAVLQDPAATAALKAGITSFQNAAAHTESITRKINDGQGTLGALVNDRALYEDLRSMLGHTDRGRVARRVFRAAGAGEADKAQTVSP